MSDIQVVEARAGDHPGKRSLVIKKHGGRFFLDSLDVGWRLVDSEGVACEIWWGNTKNDDSLVRLIANLVAEGIGPFDVLDYRNTN